MVVSVKLAASNDCYVSYQSRMTGIFKSRRLKSKMLMKHLGIVPIILLLGVGFIGGLASAELTASQQVPSPAAVGDTVMVTVSLVYNGINSTEAVITPNLPGGVVSDMPGSQTSELYPGALSPVSYPIRAEQSGTYWIATQIAYSDDGTWRSLQLEAPFTATGGVTTEPQITPGGVTPGISVPGGITPGEVTPGGVVTPDGVVPSEPLPGNGTPEEGMPGMPNDGRSGHPGGRDNGGLPFGEPGSGGEPEGRSWL
jgi:hypothetical protein